MTEIEKINSNYNYSYKNIKKNAETLKKEVEGKSGFYRHRFLLELTTAQTGLPSVITIIFNCISVNATPYKKLGDLEGDGFIINAFGMLGDVIADVRLLYQGNLFLYMSYQGTISSFIISNMANVQIFDSVAKL